MTDSIEAREAIRIAEKWFPNDTGMQKVLSVDILEAIITCQGEFAADIQRRFHAASLQTIQGMKLKERKTEA